MPLAASRTALATSMMRALHTRFDRPLLIDDDWALRLLTPEERAQLAAPALEHLPPEERHRLIASGAADAFLHARWRQTSLYGGVIIRSRYAEDHVQAAVSRGIRQYVLLGAGFDSFALRQPDFARDLQIFEVDHPASQQLKRDRIAAAGIVPPPNLHFVLADLSCVDLPAAMANSPFRPAEPALFSWLGVTVYLTREANLATLRALGAFAAPGSELVFTYIEQSALDTPSPAMGRAIALAAAVGEPWLSGFHSATLAAELLPLGLHLVEDLGGTELSARYCSSRTDNLSPGRASRIARAQILPR